MAVNLNGDYDEVFKFKSNGNALAHIWLMQETLAYIEEQNKRGREVANITYHDEGYYYAFRITYV